MRSMPIDPGRHPCRPAPDHAPSLAECMSRRVRSVVPAATVHDARQTMKTHRIRHLVVVDADRLVGILSDRDLRGRRATMPVAGVMSRDVVTLGPGTDLLAAAQLMERRSVGALPVVEAGRVVGIVTRRDVIRILAELTPGPSSSAEPRPARRRAGGT